MPTGRDLGNVVQAKELRLSVHFRAGRRCSLANNQRPTGERDGFAARCWLCLAASLQLLRQRLAGARAASREPRTATRGEKKGAQSCTCSLRTTSSIRLRAGSHAGRARFISPPKPSSCSRALVEERPRALSKQELLDRIWPGVFVSDASLARAVSEIRDAIADHSRSDGFLQTVQGFGYRFAVAGVTERVEPSTRGEPSREPVCWLVGRNQEFRLGAGDHVIGREPGVSIRLDSPRVSRHHARFVVGVVSGASGRDVSVEDLGSKNGTFVRGIRIDERTRLSSGDDIQIGPITLILRIVEGLDATETEVWNEGSS